MTEVAARALRDQYRFLSTVDDLIGLTGLEIEYDKLESTVHRRGTKTFGTLTVNKAKNRYANVDMLPCKQGKFDWVGGQLVTDIKLLSIVLVRGIFLLCNSFLIAAFISPRTMQGGTAPSKYGPGKSHVTSRNVPHVTSPGMQHAPPGRDFILGDTLTIFFCQ